MKLILYSKPGCHLCAGLQEKLAQIQAIDLEIRDITTRKDWFGAYQYEIPVLFVENADALTLVPRFSPRASVRQIESVLQNYRDRSIL